MKLLNIIIPTEGLILVKVLITIDSIEPINFL